MHKILAILIVAFISCSSVGFTHSINLSERCASLEKQIKIHFPFPEVTTSSYSKVSIEGYDFSFLPRFPVLPYKTKVITFPFGTKINGIEVKTGDIITKQLDKKIQPAPPAIPLNMENVKVKIKEGSIYQSNEAYPSDWVKYNIGAGIENGKHVIFLSIHAFPCRYIPAKNELLCVDKMKIKVNYEPPEKMPMQNDVYDLLIISPSEFANALKRLVEYKDEQGIETKLVTLNEVYNGAYFASQGRDNPERIKYFIKDAIEQWGIKYVMLIGDADSFPVRYVASDAVGDFPSDLYYADVFSSNGSFCSWDKDGDNIFGERREDKIDGYPDVAIGRLPASNVAEIQILVQKILDYNVMSEKALFVGTELFWDTDLSEGDYLKEEVRKKLPGMDVIRLYEKNDYEKDGLPTDANIADEINKGILFVNFASHGSPYGMGWNLSNWEIDDLSMLYNDMLPIVFAMACSTNEFDTTDCLGEEFLLKQNGGCIAYAGSVRVAYVYLNTAIKSGLSGYMDIAFLRSYYDGCTTPGDMFAQAIMDYRSHHFMGEYDLLTILEYSLLGDPSMKINSFKGTSHAYVEEEETNEGSIKVKAIAYPLSNNSKLELFYRKVKGIGGRWEAYGVLNSQPWEWNFLAGEEGIYEFYTMLIDKNYTEEKPSVADATCIFDFSPPEITFSKPMEGGIYLFNRQIMQWEGKTIIIGKMDVKVEAYDELTGIDSVKFSIDGTTKYEDREAPNKWEWEGRALGLHEIEITAFDKVGNEAEEKMRVFIIKIF